MAEIKADGGGWRFACRAVLRAAGAGGRLLFPPVCAGCRRLVAEPGALCARCWPSLRFIEAPLCPVMGTPFAHEMGEGFLSAEAITDTPLFSRARAAVIYEGVAGRMVQALKYADRTDLAPWMARWMARAGHELIADADLVVPVPLHWRRFWSRRFNQSAELGRALSERTGLRFAPEALVRAKNTRQQVGLRTRERTENVRAAFAVPEPFRPLVKHRRVILVDDVFTTGATVGAATRALLKGGAARVDVLTFARVLPGGTEDFLDDRGMHI